MPEVFAHAPHFWERLDSVAHTQLCSAPRRELITVGVSLGQNRRHCQETLAAAWLVCVAHAAFFQPRRVRVCPQIHHVERTQRAHKHVEVLHIDGRQIEFDQHYRSPPKANVIETSGERAHDQMSHVFLRFSAHYERSAQVAARPRYAPLRDSAPPVGFDTYSAMSTPGTAVSPFKPTPIASRAKISTGIEPAPTN